jgi:hypothetical protein
MLMRNWIRAALLVAALTSLVPAAALAAGKPVAKTGAATGVSPEAATLSGAVNPNGLVTTWYFQYGKTTKYGNRTTAQDAGAGTKRVAVSAGIGGLAGKTTYHYRLVATNSAGTTLGTDRTFKTPEAPTVSTINTDANPITVLRTLVVYGYLIGPRGGGGKQVALEGNAFPYTAGFQQIGNTVVTEADGRYTFAFIPFSNIQLRVADRSDPSIVSPVLTQAVASRVRLHASRRSRRGTVRFSGSVLPAGSSSLVQFQRRTRHGGWKNAHHAIPHKRKGKNAAYFSKRVHVRRGRYRAVARPSGGSYAEGISSSVRVRRR